MLILLLKPITFFVLKEVKSPEAGQDVSMFIPEGPEDEHFVYYLTCNDNLQFVYSNFFQRTFN